MNYRHAFHAGNFADVLKHAVLVRVLSHLAAKETPFRVIETHAGAGRYDLAGERASRTGEWREGIGRIFASPPGGEAGALLEPYLAAVRAKNPDQVLRFYPGSPALACALTRPQDRLIFCELEAEERSGLIRTIARDRRVKVIAIDGWTALKAFLPPPERRGLVLIDPPFEEPGEFERLEQGLAETHRRWTGGIYLLWYPIKDARETENFGQRLSRLGIPKILRIELNVAPRRPEEPLAGCGLIAVNPPWTLERELALLLPELARALGRSGAGQFRLDWLAGES